MHRSRADTCLVIGTGRDDLKGMLMLQLDDSLGLGTAEFMEIEELSSNLFRNKGSKIVREGQQELNISMITQYNDGTVVMSRNSKIHKLEIPKSRKGFISFRALAQYIAVKVRPDICAPVQLMASGNQPVTNQEFKQLERAIKFMEHTDYAGLKFVPLDPILCTWS